MNPLIKTHIIQFVVMIIVGVCFNPMNMLAYRFDDMYFRKEIKILPEAPGE